MVRIIQESDAISLSGLVEVSSAKTYPLSVAQKVATKNANGGVPLVCELLTTSKTGRTIKRYFPLRQYVEKK